MDDDRVFKALADPTRRLLLDRLFERDGRTLTEVAMSRFGVAKHLRVLKVIHDRWIDKYAEGPAAMLAELRHAVEAEQSPGPRWHQR